MSSQDKLTKASDWTRRFSLGLMVVALYWLFVGAVFAGFATYMIRSDWSNQASVEGADLDTLFHFMRRETVLRNNINEVNQALADIGKKVDETAAELAEIARERRQVDAENRLQAAITTMTLHQVRADLDEEYAQSINAVLTDASMDLPVRVREALSLAPQAPPRPDLEDERIAEIRDLIGSATRRLLEIDKMVEDIEARQLTIEGMRERYNNERVWPQQQFEEYQTELTSLSELLPINSKDRARLGALSDIFWGVPQYMVRFPIIFLTLIVTIAAGGLGAVVSFSRAMFDDNAPTSAARLFVTVGEGIAASIAIFLASGAGFLAMSPGTDSIASLDISPYSVAFIAFVSGFLAEDAFNRIQRAGKHMFSSDERSRPEQEEWKERARQASQLKDDARPSGG